MNRAQKTPITLSQFDDATEWLETWPHAIGACTLAFVISCMAFNDLAHRITAVVWWVIVSLALSGSVAIAKDMVVAWVKGRGGGFVERCTTK